MGTTEEMQRAVAELLTLPEYLRPSAGQLHTQEPETLKMAIDIISNRRRELREAYEYVTQTHQCSGPGYAHGPHGQCSGYTYDRT